MKVLLILILSLFTLSAFAQEYPDSGFTNKAEAKNLTVNGLKEGKWVEYADDSNLGTSDTNAPYYMLIVYMKGKPRGKLLEYYKSGKLYIESPLLVNDNLNGVAKEYYENGHLKEETPYINDKRNGVEKEYYESGILKRETPYNNGKTNGIEKIYYESGKLKGEAPFKNDKESGVEKQYYENGTIWYETYYIGDNRNGVEKEYYESGKLKTETYYSKGKAGIIKNYDENAKEIK